MWLASTLVGAKNSLFIWLVLEILVQLMGICCIQGLLSELQGQSINSTAITEQTVYCSENEVLFCYWLLPSSLSAIPKDWREIIISFLLMLYVIHATTHSTILL